MTHPERTKTLSSCRTNQHASVASLRFFATGVTYINILIPIAPSETLCNTSSLGKDSGSSTRASASMARACHNSRMFNGLVAYEIRNSARLARCSSSVPWLFICIFRTSSRPCSSVRSVPLVALLSEHSFRASTGMNVSAKPESSERSNWRVRSLLALFH